METATSRQLARRALAWYSTGGRPPRTTPVERVAALALEAVQSSRRLSAPRNVRWQIALNALAQTQVERAIRGRWKPSGHAPR
jgi:hypothetical protein